MDDELKAKLGKLIENSKERVEKAKWKLISELIVTDSNSLDEISADHFDELWKEFRESAQDLAALEAARAFIND